MILFKPLSSPARSVEIVIFVREKRMENVILLKESVYISIGIEIILRVFSTEVLTLKPLQR